MIQSLEPERSIEYTPGGFHPGNAGPWAESGSRHVAEKNVGWRVGEVNRNINLESHESMRHAYLYIIYLFDLCMYILGI